MAQLGTASLPSRQAGYEDGAKRPSVVEPPPYANHFRVKDPEKDNQGHLVNLFQIKQQEEERSSRIIWPKAPSASTRGNRHPDMFPTGQRAMGQGIPRKSPAHL